ncbi:MAG TPA: class I SAM-dependent methyltransferase [Candidatus Paceibacterota bacterium]|nr:class I SAM-dependent methyltransferase [Candidatus Paceibacterota bacterium]
MTEEEERAIALEAETLRFYTDHGDLFSNEEFSHHPNFLTDLLYLASLLEPDPILLDVGCGSGRCYSDMREFGRYIGFDPSSKAIEQAREKYPDGDFRVGNMHAIKECVTEVCDLFISQTSLMHIPPARMPSALQNIRSVMRTGGFGNILLPIGDSEVVSTHESISEMPPGYSVYSKSWTLEELASYLTEARFEIIRPTDNTFFSGLTVSVRAI